MINSVLFHERNKGVISYVDLESNIDLDAFFSFVEQFEIYDAFTDLSHLIHKQEMDKQNNNNK